MSSVTVRVPLAIRRRGGRKQIIAPDGTPVSVIFGLTHGLGAERAVTISLSCAVALSVIGISCGALFAGWNLLWGALTPLFALVLPLPGNTAGSTGLAQKRASADAGPACSNARLATASRLWLV